MCCDTRVFFMSSPSAMRSTKNDINEQHTKNLRAIKIKTSLNHNLVGQNLVYRLPLSNQLKLTRVVFITSGASGKVL